MESTVKLIDHNHFCEIKKHQNVNHKIIVLPRKRRVIKVNTFQKRGTPGIKIINLKLYQNIKYLFRVTAWSLYPKTKLVIIDQSDQSIKWSSHILSKDIKKSSKKSDNRESTQQKNKNEIIWEYWSDRDQLVSFGILFDQLEKFTRSKKEFFLQEIKITNFDPFKLSRTLPKIDSRYVVVKGSGGFGDCINVLIRAWYFAEASDRILLIDWRNNLYDPERIPLTHFNEIPWEYNSNIWNHLFSYPKNNVNLVKLNHETDLTTLPKDWQNKLHCSEGHIRAEWIYNQTNDIFPQLTLPIDHPKYQEFRMFRREINHVIYQYPEKKKQPKSDTWMKQLIETNIIVFNGPNIKNLPIEIEQYYYERLEIHPSIVHRAEEFYQEKLKPKVDLTIEKPNIVIAVHFRHGNGEAVLQHYAQQEHFGQFIMKIQVLLKKLKLQAHPIEKIKLLLCTDSPIVIEVFKNLYSDFLVITDKWMPPSNSGPLHKNNNIPCRIKCAKEALMEMHLLSLADYLICNHSSFNWYAQYRSKFDSDHLIQIK